MSSHHTLFLDLPTYSDPAAIAFLQLHGLDFTHWPRGMLPPAISQHLQQTAERNFDVAHDVLPAHNDDVKDLEAYLASCASERAILRTHWGYLTGDQSPRWIDGALVLVSTVAIAGFGLGQPVVVPRLRTMFVELLKREARRYRAVTVMAGNEVELCRIMCQCDSTDAG
jgi:hypothetical protein